MAANKCELASDEQIARFGAFVREQGYPFYVVSAATRRGLRDLVNAVSRALEELPPIVRYESDFVREEAKPLDYSQFTVRRADDAAYEVVCDWAGALLGSVNMDDYESLQYFQRVLRQSGVIDRLEEMGIQEGDTVRVGDFEFTFVY